MADASAQIPADLVELKRRLLAGQARQAALAAALPPSLAVARGQAALTAQQQADWSLIQAELTDLAVRINRHPALAVLSPVDRYALDRAATKAAQEAAQEAGEEAGKEAAGTAAS